MSIHVKHEQGLPGRCLAVSIHDIKPGKTGPSSPHTNDVMFVCFGFLLDIGLADGRNILTDQRPTGGSVSGETITGNVCVGVYVGGLQGRNT